MVCVGVRILLRSVCFAAVLLLLPSGKGLCVSCRLVISSHRIKQVLPKLRNSVCGKLWGSCCMGPLRYRILSSGPGLNVPKASPDREHPKSGIMQTDTILLTARLPLCYFRHHLNERSSVWIRMRFLYAAHKVRNHPLLRISVKFLSHTSSMYQCKVIVRALRIPNTKYY